MQKHESGFIGNFKTGDNIAYNLLILCTLHKVYKENKNQNERSHLRKPMIIIMVSTIEAIMFDYRYRAKTFTTEGVKHIDKKSLIDIREGKKDLFDKLISMFQKHNIFFQVPKFYDGLHELRKIRNRVHIQNESKYKPYDEMEIYTKEQLKDTAYYLEYVIRFMSKNHNRKKSYVEEFKLPWKPLLDESDIIELK